MYRNHLNSFDYKYRIDVQPQIAVPIDAMKQGLRFILFNLNKKYLKVRQFGHLPPEQKFWALAFKEGDAVSKGEHYHILLHCPVVDAAIVEDGNLILTKAFFLRDHQRPPKLHPSTNIHYETQ